MAITNISRIMFILMILFFSPLSLAATPQERAVQDAYQAWCTAIGKAKGDPKIVLKYYADNAVLLPTLSHKILINKNHGMDNYFKGLTSNPDIQCQTDTLVTNLYGDFAINYGYYTFHYTKDNKTVEVPARFTFVYIKQDDQWMIVNHHSSTLPS